MKMLSSPTRSLISTLAPSSVPMVSAPLSANFILPVPDASMPAVEMSAEAWPRAPEPNPLLPNSHWQRSRDVPRATAARELAYARALTRRPRRIGADGRVLLPRHGGRPQEPAVAAALAHLPPAAATWLRPAPVARALFASAPAREQSSWMNTRPHGPRVRRSAAARR